MQALAAWENAKAATADAAKREEIINLDLVLNMSHSPIVAG